MEHTNQPNLEPQAETLSVLLQHLGGRALQTSELDGLLGIVVRVCDAASLAHRCDMLHCNLEPGNVTVGSHGEVHVKDACVAIGSDHILPSHEEDAPATAGYMAPEQAWGRRHDCDARTDVYGIGGILYAILTRTAPHSGGSASADLALAKSGTVCAAGDVCPERALPAALCRIAARALAASPSERHPSVEVLKHDIERFMSTRRSTQQVAAA